MFRGIDFGDPSGFECKLSVIKDNYAGVGSGVYVQGNSEGGSDTNDFCNVRIRDNGDWQAPVGSGQPISNDGGGMWIGQRVDLRASNCLIHGNRATNEGGGIY